ncbi:MAG: agmatinase [Candidatus Micrarchaeota archaeon]
MTFTGTSSKKAFMGFQHEPADSRAVVLQVPYEGTVSYMEGTAKGPGAIISASNQVELYDIELDKEPALEFGIRTAEPLEPEKTSEKTMMKVRDAIGGIVRDGKFPIVFGGEHSISTGPVLALKEKYSDLSVLQIDAHADLREEYHGDNHSHACVMARIREQVDRAVQVGIRSMEREEMARIKRSRLEEFVHGPDFEADKVVGQLSENVYVTIDLDGFDPSEVPGVGTPEPGGIHWKQGIELLRKVAEKKNVVGFDIVELIPIPGSVQSEFFAAKLAYKMLGYSLLRQVSGEPDSL